MISIQQEEYLKEVCLVKEIIKEVVGLNRLEGLAQEDVVEAAEEVEEGVVEVHPIQEADF
jgi:hypothetical protein